MKIIEAGQALYSIGYLFVKSTVQLTVWIGKSAGNMLYTPKPLTEAEKHEMFEQDRQELLHNFQRTKPNEQLALGGKTVSYLFRPRNQISTKLNMSQFNKVLSIDSEEKIARVGGMTSFYDLVQETLKKGLLPQVVPELRGITVGGAVAGMAIESSSFKYGLVQDTILEMEVLSGEGKIYTCTRDNEHSDLFYGMPNSYGTLGYAVSLKVSLVPAAPFVKLEHIKFNELNEYFFAITESCKLKNNYAFIDGTIFSQNLMVMTRATFVEHAPYVSNYRRDGVYYKSMQEKNEDYLTTYNYIWRWDADSFWSTEINGKPTLLQNSSFRKLFGDIVLRGDRLSMLKKVIDEFSTNIQKLSEAISGNKPVEVHKEKIVQDLGIPIENCAKFVSWLDEQIGIYPMFVCPTQSQDQEEQYPLWDFHQVQLACDIGIFGSRYSEKKMEKGFFNRMIEDEVEKQKGKKSLYSQSFFNKENFERLYHGGGAYEKLKERYDPDERFPTLYEKCVLNK